MHVSVNPNPAGTFEFMIVYSRVHSAKFYKRISFVI